VRRAVFPGSFDPATIAHIAIADAALEQCRCDHVTFALSRSALGKGDREESLGRRAGALAALLADRHDLDIEVVDARLIADIAIGFDVVIVGADKWAQILDPAWYPSVEEHAAGLDRLPEVALVPRPPTEFDLHPKVATTVLSLAEARLAHVSSTAVRAGRSEWAATRPAGQGGELSGR
jgi:hypothetical protein